MGKKIEPNVKVINNATRNDVRPGDRLLRRDVGQCGDVTVVETREGTASYRNVHGDWFSADDIWLTDGEGEGVTLTIRRAAQELPTEDGAVIVPADGREHIATNEGVANALVHLAGKWYGGAFQIEPEQIVPGTWQLAGK